METTYQERRGGLFERAPGVKAAVLTPGPSFRYLTGYSFDQLGHGNDHPCLFVLTDDRPHKRNGVSVAPGIEDEHGPVAQVHFEPSEGDQKRRDELAEVGAEILREAGASHVHRSDSPPTAIHIHSTMRMGKVVDEACEAYEVERLFVADHSVLANGVGGPNPTNTGQALAARTGERIVERYF